MNTLGADNPQVVDPSGRWPANLVLSHLEGCSCLGTKKVKASVNNHYSKISLGSGRGTSYQGGKGVMGACYADQEGKEVVLDWDCVERCPTKLLNQQGKGSRFFKQVKE